MAPVILLAIAIGVAVVGIVSHQVMMRAKPPLSHGLGSSSGSNFDLIASRYDMINRVLAMRLDIGWRKTLVHGIQQHLQQEDIVNPRLLDVATGTADVALMLAKEIPRATIIGVDPSNGMLDVGRVKIHSKSLDDRIDLQWADVRDLTHIPSNSFHGGTMAFGIRNVPEREEALCQIHRVLQPNALFGILEFSEPHNKGIMGAAARFFINRVVPMVGGILSGRPRMYLHLQNSIQGFPTPTEFARLMEALHCEGGSLQSYHVEKVLDKNFGSVQIYFVKSLKQTNGGGEIGNGSPKRSP